MAEATPEEKVIHRTAIGMRMKQYDINAEADMKAIHETYRNGKYHDVTFGPLKFRFLDEGVFVFKDGELIAKYADAQTPAEMAQVLHMWALEKVSEEEAMKIRGAM